MRKILYTIVGSALALALGSITMPAAADVTVTANLTKDKDVDIDVFIHKVKTVDLIIDRNLSADGGAEALAIANVVNKRNLVTASDQAPGAINDLTDYDIFRTVLLTGSVLDNSGIVELNQDAGNMVNQGNELALALVNVEGSGQNDTVFTEADAWADQVNKRNTVRHLEENDVNEFGRPRADTPAFNPATDNVSTLITGSINDNTGIVGVNQNAGNMNNQHNVVAMAAGFGTEFALAEGALGQENASNDVFEAGVIKAATITDSINGNTGVVSVNQAAGNMANQANIFALSFVAGGP